MKNKLSLKSDVMILGIVSTSIPLVVFLLILNWFFKITSYQKFEGMPLMIAPFTSVIGFILSYISLKKSPNNLAKWSIIFNGVLFVSSFLYWTVGTMIFGP